MNTKVTPLTLETETKRLSRKAMLHVGGLLGLLGFVAYLDRIVVAFAGPHGMNKDLSLTATAFGFVVGIFTIGYVLFEVPSAGIVARIGPRRWITRIMLTWGIIQCLIAFAPNLELMMLGRFLLGAAEAGFTPAVYYLFTVWFIRGYRPFLIVIFGLFLGAAGIFGPTIAASFVGIGNSLGNDGFPGWRFLLLGVGVLALVAAIPAWRFIAESPADARWLNEADTATYCAILAADIQGANVPAVSAKEVLTEWRPWVMGLGFFCLYYATYTITIWTPTIVSGFQAQFSTPLTTLQSSLLAGVPLLVAVLAAAGAAFIASGTGRSAALVVGATIIGAIGCIITTFAPGPGVLIVALGMVAMAGQIGGTLFIPIISRVFAGVGAYVAIALVNSMGAFAGFVSPIVTGWLVDVTANQNAGFYVMSVLLLVGGMITIFAEAQARKFELTRATNDAAALTIPVSQSNTSNLDSANSSPHPAHDV
ncbi:MFS transporter [Rhodococcus qingshengii]|uniref:MFS transporter n=1 Tax=Rhodococcus qingshengii TaxID=334542 RepID=UPI001BEC898A|nr:MFS transporter [Rhodococcus qingshengii]MBT2273588.1 MFS transporter [Rhodococcus qingshengii]